jgi:hypothetical protein
VLETLGEIGIKNCPNIHALIISNQSDGFGTLLTITEANYMRFNEFKKGQIVKWKDEIGEVNFIDKMYITITLHRWKKPPELAEGSCYPYGEVNLLCNNKYWDELELQSNTEEQQSSSAMYKSQEGRYIDP